MVAAGSHPDRAMTDRTDSANRESVERFFREVAAVDCETHIDLRRDWERLPGVDGTEHLCLRGRARTTRAKSWSAEGSRWDHPDGDLLGDFCWRRDPQWASSEDWAAALGRHGLAVETKAGLPPTIAGRAS